MPENNVRNDVEKPATERDTGSEVTQKMDRQASDVMTAHPETVSPSDTLDRVAKLMVECDCGAIPVCESDGKVVGIITDRDIVIRTVAVGKNPLECKVSDAMTESVVTVQDTAALDEVVRLMSEHKIRRIPVVGQEGHVVGLIAQADIARNGSFDRKVGQMVEEISKPGHVEARP